MTADSLITDEFRLVATQKQALHKLGLKTIRDLLFYFPRGYGELSETKTISELRPGDHAMVWGKITKIEMGKAFRKKTPLTRATLEDATGKLKIVWFHQPYIAKMLQAGSYVWLKGKVSDNKGVLSMINPNSEGGAQSARGPAHQGTGIFFNEEHSGTGILQPVYAETQGITSRWFYYTLKKVLAAHVHETIPDYIPEEMLKKYNLPTLKTALVWIHHPRKKDDALAARKRFAFEEVFFVQLARLQERQTWEENPSFKILDAKKGRDEFVKRFPFTLTSAQEKAIAAIVGDFEKGKPMSRLLEGDVGSGKTAVAAATAYAIVTSRPDGQNFGNLQTAIMAPTEILAKQHFDSFIENFSHLPIHVGLITSAGCKKFPSKVNPTKATDISRPQLLKWIAEGIIPIVVGTHALIQKTVQFKHLAYVIVDEQHRFGVNQRAKLAKKEPRVPHFLSMSATPIPRTLALTIYGDLDLTLLDEMPAGRKPIMTEIVLPDERAHAYEKVRKELVAGRQAYVICPRIDEPDPNKRLALNVKSVKAEAKRLKKEVFPEYEVEILHSKMSPKEKDATMERFAGGKTHILVATSVIEVGVNIPNATTIIIEGADRFGLAQLHQLRGRVLRSTHQANCFIFTDSKSSNSLGRLRALARAKNGFELAEMDLGLRGAGELSGKKQWGISDVGMEAIKNIKMVEAARAEAQSLLAKDPDLSKHPHTKERVDASRKEIHFE